MVENIADEHRKRFEFFIDFLIEKDIKYVIIRGYDRLPLFPNTDLDIVIEQDRYQEVLSFLSEHDHFNTDELHRAFSINGVECSYNPFFTNFRLCNKIPNGSFRLDLYNHFFFFSKKHVLHNKIEEDIFKTSILYKNRYSVASPCWDSILLLYRSLFDKSGFISDKYKKRIKFLMPQITNSKQELARCLNLIEEFDPTAFNTIRSYTDNKNIFNFYSENIAFIMWTDKPTKLFLKTCEENSLNIIRRQKMLIQGDHKRKYEMVNKIYEIKMNPADPRIFYTHPFEVFIYKDHNPSYSNSGKPANIFKTPKILNTKSFQIKSKIRKNYSHLHIHGCDEIHESNKVFEFFNLKEYMNEYAVIPTKILRAVLYNKRVNGSYDLVKIENTPHYKMLLGDKEGYRIYTTVDPDPKHTVDSFENLINKFNPVTVMCDDDNMISCQIDDTGYFIITDGLHRASLMKFYNFDFIRVKIRNPKLKNHYDFVKPDRLEVN